MRGVVVFRHGILLNRLVMEPLARRLRRRGFVVENSSYPTTRKPIEEHARDLFHELCRLAEREEKRGGPYELHAVTHSMGGLVLRYALTHFPAPPVRRAVEIAPPNQGSVTARSLKRLALYRWLCGKSGLQLAEEPPGLFGECGVPSGVEIGIIAGTGGRRWLPVPVPRPHDGIVALEETRLESFPVLELPYGHTPILFRRRLFEEVASFLELGRFRDGSSLANAAVGR